VQIYSEFAERNGLPEKSFDEAFKARFGALPVEDDINSSHQMVIVAAELDASTERIINYLNDKASVAVNAVFFSVFQDGDNQYLSRAWMIDPVETEEHAVNTRQKGEWNGEFYASFGAGPGGRSWEDAINHGFISAGGGRTGCDLCWRRCSRLDRLRLRRLWVRSNPRDSQFHLCARVWRLAAEL
jgi:hypothetical protein